MDFEFLFGLEQVASWPAYCGQLESQRLGVTYLRAGCTTFLVAEAEGQIVGRFPIRQPRSNAHLAEVGGHIDTGCVLAFVAAVTRRPSWASPWRSRRRLVLDRVLVTCDDDNVGSANVIENCGGVLENVVAGRDGSAAERDTWVEISAGHWSIATRSSDR